MPDDAPPPSEVERELGDRYQIVRTLGRGAFGAVYLARERLLHRMVAIKVLRADRAASEGERARLLREARTVANLSHPAIVPLLAFGESAAIVYMVMPYVGGETLADRLADGGRVAPHEARRILIEIADALAYAHGEGVLHRDLKPENILLERAGAVGDGVPPRVRLIDFGVAAFHTRDPGVNATYETWGTPQFMAPEQAFGEPELDPRSEIYSLGVLGYLLLGGALPFAATSPTERLIEQRRGPGVPLASLAAGAPPDLIDAVERCLAYEPEARWRRARDVRDALVRGAGPPTAGLEPLSVVRQRLRGRPGDRDARARRLAAARRAAAPRPSVAAMLRGVVAGLGADARYALRTLAKTPGFTAAVVVTLALGIAATTVVFTATEALVLRPLPAADPRSLVLLGEEQERSRNIDFGASVFRHDRYLAYRDATREIFSGVAGQQYKAFSVRLGGEARAVSGLVTSRNYFDVLGVRPARGRFYGGAEEGAGAAEATAVVGHSFWQRVLGGDPDAVGRTIFVDSRPMTIVGVAPPGFSGAFVGVLAFDVWVPAQAYALLPSPRGEAGAGEAVAARFNLFARLRPGVSVDRATTVLRTVAPRVPADDPARRTLSAWAEPLGALPREVEASAARFIAVLLGVAATVLLIAATNAAGMLLARGAARAREIATRLAVGASRARLARQLFVESTLLCVAGGAAGLVLAWWPVRLLNVWQPPLPLPLAVRFGFNATVLAGAAAAVLGAALVAGLVPALHGTRLDLAEAMKDGGLQTGRRRTRLRNGFVVAQVALSVMLLAVAGLFTRSLQRTVAVDPGIDARGVAHGRLTLAPHGYTEGRAGALFARLVQRLRARPEIAAAAVAANAPLTGSTSTSDATRPDRPGDTLSVQWTVADAGLVELLRMPLLAGRAIAPTDGPGAPPVAVVNETLVRRLWPGLGLSDVLGRTLDSRGERLTVVGVLGAGRYTTLQEAPRPFGLVAFRQNARDDAMLFMRARGDPASALRAAREELAALDPNVAIERAQSYASDLDRYLVPQQIGASLVGTFGGVGLALVTIGLYGVLAYAVTQRRREFAVRMALGARAADVVRLVVRQGLALVGVGIALGLVAALAAGRLVAGFLFGLSPADPVTLAAVPLVLLVAALAACAVPARRGAASDPMSSLRAE